jgi:lipid-A-disaccharide synthase
MTLVNLLATDQIYADAEHPDLYDRHHPGHDDVLLPEYPTWRDRSVDLASHVVEWLTDEPARQRAIARLAELRDRIGKGGASAIAAEYIVRHLEQSEPRALSFTFNDQPATYRKAS